MANIVKRNKVIKQKKCRRISLHQIKLSMSEIIKEFRQPFQKSADVQ